MYPNAFAAAVTQLSQKDRYNLILFLHIFVYAMQLNAKNLTVTGKFKQEMSEDLQLFSEFAEPVY